jgi:hypothetical protein
MIISKENRCTVENDAASLLLCARRMSYEVTRDSTQGSVEYHRQQVVGGGRVPLVFF